MGSAAAPTLNRLRQSLAGIDPSLTPALPGCGREVGFDPAIDAALGGGLACGALHELAPAAPAISAPPVALPLRLLRSRAAQTAARCSGSAPITR